MTRDPDTRYTQGQNGQICVARYTLAVDRRRRVEGEQNADFISCVAFGRSGEFADKYLRKGMKIAVSGRIQTGSYVNKDGVKVYTTDVIVEEQEFCESKQTTTQAPAQSPPPVSERVAQAERAMEAKRNRDEALDGFMDLPDTIDDEDLPFT